MLQMKWYFIDNTLRNVTVSFPIMAQVRDINISDALKFPGIFAPLICFKWNDFWWITLSVTLVSGSTIMAQVRDNKISDNKISDALKFPGIFTPLICFK